jgi:CheY-like chemotaxis protein
MDGREALQWLAEQETLPDLVLLDCMMPHMSGHEFCAILRQVGNARDQWILLHSCATCE